MILLLCGGYLFFGNVIQVVYCIRCIGGFLYGFIYITLITQIGDNVRKSIRGNVTTSLSIVQTFALFAASVFAIRYWESYSNMRAELSICTLIAVAVVIVLTLFYTKEPVTRLILLKQEREARNTLSYLYAKFEDDAVNFDAEFDGIKQMIAEDYKNMDTDSSYSIFKNGNYIPLRWMILLRVVGVLMSNPVIYVLSTDNSQESDTLLTIMYMFLLRLVVLLIPKYLVDRVGRRPFLLLSGIGFGFSFTIFCFTLTSENRPEIRLLSVILLHIFAAIGVDPIQHIYAVELFPISKRNGSLALITAIEYILQAALIFIWMAIIQDGFDVILIITALLPISLSIQLSQILPETKLMDLRQCHSFYSNTS